MAGLKITGHRGETPGRWAWKVGRDESTSQVLRLTTRAQGLPLKQVLPRRSLQPSCETGAMVSILHLRQRRVRKGP